MVIRRLYWIFCIGWEYCFGLRGSGAAIGACDRWRRWDKSLVCWHTFSECDAKGWSTSCSVHSHAKPRWHFDGHSHNLMGCSLFSKWGRSLEDRHIGSAGSWLDKIGQDEESQFNLVLCLQPDTKCCLIFTITMWTGHCLEYRYLILCRKYSKEEASDRLLIRFSFDDND